jgi:hypothetical protein
MMDTQSLMRSAMAASLVLSNIIEMKRLQSIY